MDDGEDGELLDQVHGIIDSMEKGICKLLISPHNSLRKRLLSEIQAKCRSRGNRQQINEKLTEIQKSVEGWDGKEISQMRLELFHGIFIMILESSSSEI